jgi:uncharacterized protein (UPF0332 family)
MPFDWHNFLTLAEELAAGFDEASKRTAISRAYYCVFNLAVARAVSKVGPRPKDTPSHQWCWDQWTLDPACRQLGNTGDRMKRMRHKADYNPKDNPRMDDDVRRMLEEAHQFLAALAALDPEYPRP